MRGILRFAKISSVLVFLLAMVVGFQNCTDAAQFSGVSTAAQSGSGGGSGNGDSYTGKPGYYTNHDPNEVCSQRTPQGKPFPTRQIFIQGSTYQLVREHCRDIAPVLIPRSELSIDPATDIVIYRGQSFDPRPNLAEYNFFAATCPAGRTVTNPNPANIYTSSLDLSQFTVHPQIVPRLYGSIEALPRWAIEHTETDPAWLHDWVRVSQQPVIETNTMYAVSFLLEPGTVDKAVMVFDDNGSYARIDVDMGAGTATTGGTGGSMGPATATIRRYGNGWYVTMFVTSGPGATYGDVGVAASRLNGTDDLVQTGDMIYATAASWYKVNDYCSP